MTPLEFHSALMAFAYRTRASVTSYGRTESRNAAVGGVNNSYHLLWMAADVVYDNPAPPPEVRQRTGTQLGLKVVLEGDHDHLQPL